MAKVQQKEVTKEKVGKYWEEEDPQVNNFGQNQFRFYPNAEKLQVYRRKDGTPNGVTKGCTMELDKMSIDELTDLAELISNAIAEVIDGREEEEKPKKKSTKSKKRLA
jgi:hypothetical protein